MEPPQLNWIAGFIWGIADDVLRDLYVRGKYRDVILPMTVLRRFDAVLEPTKQTVLDMKASLDKARLTNQDAALRKAVKIKGLKETRERDENAEPIIRKIHNKDTPPDPISFTRYFYKPKPMRTLQNIRADIGSLGKESAGLLDEIIGGKV